MPDDAGPLDSQRVEQSDDPLCVRVKREGSAGRRIAATEPQEVGDHEAVARWHLRDDIAPEVARRRKPVEEDDRLAGTTSSGSVVVESCAADIDELTAH